VIGDDDDDDDDDDGEGEIYSDNTTFFYYTTKLLQLFDFFAIAHWSYNTEKGYNHWF
jgi:hypothetical protein